MLLRQENTISSKYFFIELDPICFYRFLDGRQWNCYSILGRCNWIFSSPNCIGRFCSTSSFPSILKCGKNFRGQKNLKVTTHVLLLSKSRMRGAMAPFPQLLYDVVFRITRGRFKGYPYLHFTRKFRC